MLLAKISIIRPSEEEKFILDYLALASAKIWNIGNYEKYNYKDLGLNEFPNYFDQRHRLKNNYWYKCLMAQTAQNTLDDLQKGWKSYIILKSKGYVNIHPPGFKDQKYNFTYFKQGFKNLGNDIIRLSIPKNLKNILKKKIGLQKDFLELKIPGLSNINILVIEFIPLNNGKYKIIAAYEYEEPKILDPTGRYLSIDIGCRNLLTCYHNVGYSFIIDGSKLLSIYYYFDKKISQLQSISYKQHNKSYYKTKQIKRLYEKRMNEVNNYLHQATKKILDYCLNNNVTRVIIGDITNIRDNNRNGKIKEIHRLPYRKLYSLLNYKLIKYGIILIKQKEYYTSQCSPFAPKVSRIYATKQSRVKNLFFDNNIIYNADSLGAYNILKLYSYQSKTEIDLPVAGLSNPKRIYITV